MSSTLSYHVFRIPRLLVACVSTTTTPTIGVTSLPYTATDARATILLFFLHPPPPAVFSGLIFQALVQHTITYIHEHKHTHTHTHLSPTVRTPRQSTIWKHKHGRPKDFVCRHRKRPQKLLNLVTL